VRSSSGEQEIAVNANLGFVIGECELFSNGHSTTREAEVAGPSSEGLFARRSLFGLRLSLFFCERLFGAPIGVSFGDHDVEDGLTTLFSGFNQVVLAKLSQVVLKPFVLLFRHTALGDIDGQAGQV